MFFLTPILAGLILVGTLGTGAYVKGEAQEVVSRYNFKVLSQSLEIYYIDRGKYPKALNELVADGLVKNLNADAYLYQVSSDRQNVKLCDTISKNCWNSKDSF